MLIENFHGFDVLPIRLSVGIYGYLIIPSERLGVPVRAVRELYTLSKVPGYGLINGVTLPGFGQHGDGISLFIPLV